ncbi:MAG TPA: GNAT family N-acyltransferase [Rhodocyclaceae bacterium]|jgi:putative hemolysin|nr:GNAT family N-acyltransferase [Rhodocyclaceae bacterium]
MLQIEDSTLLANAAVEKAADKNHDKAHYTVSLARTAQDVIEAQRLRYRVFAEEMGARLNVREAGIDSDIYDAFCEHLIVRDETADKVVGTYRILTPDAARRVGSYYSESEFDLVRLHQLRDRTVEVGRSCIDPDYRNGAIISLLWAKLAEFMLTGGYDYLIGCASIGMADGGHNAANIFVHLIDEYIAPPEYRVFPRNPLPFERLVTGVKPEVPPLVKGYLRAGAYVCGEPAWDPDFNTADLFLLLPMSRISKRYAKHFLHQEAVTA